MCLNCGCGDYDDKRGNETNITMEDVKNASEGEEMLVKETINEMLEALTVVLEDLEA